MTSGFCCLSYGILACNPLDRDPLNRDLASVFPEVAQTLGSFSIVLDRSQNPQDASQAKIVIQQSRQGKAITLLMKMTHSNEHVNLSFVRRGQKAQESFSRCGHFNLGTDDFGDLVEETQALASDTQEAKAKFQKVWLAKIARNVKDFDARATDATIDLRWSRDSIPETFYPLQSDTHPKKLRGWRLDGDREHDIDVTWRHGFVELSAQDVKPGSWLQLQYEVPGIESEFDLPQQPLPIDFKSLVMIPGCLRDNFLLEKTHLSWTCQQTDGPLWAASYTFHRSLGPMKTIDWPKFAQLPPASRKTWSDQEGRITCEESTWTSGSAH